MTASITETIIENGKSRFIMPLSTVTGVITAQIANISTRLKISDPIMLLIAISLEPAIAADTLTASSGSSGGGRNSSVTISTQKEEIYESKDFASLDPGEFIGMGNRFNIKGHFRKKFRLLKLEEEPLLVVAFRAEKKISDNYTRILKDIERVFEMEDTEEDVNSLFSDR